MEDVSGMLVILVRLLIMNLGWELVLAHRVVQHQQVPVMVATKLPVRHKTILMGEVVLGTLVQIVLLLMQMKALVEQRVDVHKIIQDVFGME